MAGFGQVPSVAESLARIADTLEAVYDVMERRLELAQSRAAASAQAKAKETRGARAVQVVDPSYLFSTDTGSSTMSEFKRMQEAIQAKDRAEQAARAARQKAALAERADRKQTDSRRRKPKLVKSVRVRGQQSED